MLYNLGKEAIYLIRRRAAVKRSVSLSAILVVVATAASAQVTDFNTFYKHLISFGLEYHSLSPTQFYGDDFDSYEITGIVRFPLPFLPMLQPMAQAGVYQFTSSSRLDPDLARWDHMHWYGLLGAAYSHKFSKSVEMGGEIGVGFTEAIYQNLDLGLSEDIWGSPHFLSYVAGVVGFNPSYNIHIYAKPSVRFFRSFTPLDKLNGFTLGIGFGVSYRVGEDPDAPQVMVRAIRLAESEMKPVFAAMQSYYVKNPVGEVVLTNIEKYPLTDVSIAFYQEGFMDTPTTSATVTEIKPGESATVSLFASFNNEVFSPEGITPLNGEILVDYSMRNKPVSQTFPVTYELHDKTALTWDDLRKVAAFITPQDSALRNYASFIRQSGKDVVVLNLNERLQIAMQVYSALDALGCLYQPDPAAPFQYVQDNPVYVDSISIPRDTMKRLTGDCDDLTVLYCSLLETVGIPTGYVTTPGHIYAAFSTGARSKEYRDIHPDRSMTISLEDELWVLVEITMVGNADFLAAWRTGIQEYAAYEKNPELRDITIRSVAQQEYRPVVLKESDLGVQYGFTRQPLAEDFEDTVRKLVDVILADYEDRAKESGSKRGYNTLGIKAAEFERLLKAEDAFNTALSIDRNYLHPQINLGNVLYLKQDFENALRVLHRAEQQLVKEGKEGSTVHAQVLLSLSKCYYELENFDKAKEYFDKAAEYAPEVAQADEYIRTSGESGGRAAAAVAPSIQFASEEE